MDLITMTRDDSDLQLIKKHMKGNLSPAEAREFAARLAMDARFAAEVDFHQKLFATLRDREHDRLKKMLQGVETENFPQKPGNGRWLLWLLAILALAAVAWFLYGRYQQETNPAPVYARYFKPYENTVSVSTRSPETQTGLAWQAYDAGNFTRAVELFEKIPAAEQSDDTDFFKGVALLASGNAGKSIPVFEQLERATPPRKYAEQARWYLALAYLKAGQADKTRVLLAKITNQAAHFNRSKAVALGAELSDR